MTGVAGLVLAAGAGRRFGGPKALVRLGGQLLVERVCGTLADGGCAPVVVVLGARADDIRAAADLPDTVDNPDWTEGMGSSLRVGLGALPVDAGAVVVALVDQPLVGAEAVRRLSAAWRGGAVAAVASYDGRPRNPVLLDRSVFVDVAASAQGDVGARAWLRTHPDVVVTVPCGDTGTARDIDTPDDLAAVEALSS